MNVPVQQATIRQYAKQLQRKRSTNAPVQGGVFMLKCKDEWRTAVNEPTATDKRGS